MPSFAELFGLLGLIAAAGYWLAAMRSKELARDAGLRACRQADVQFLDDTVQLVKARLRRDPRGRIAVYREYRFEFTRDGEHRHRGEIVLLGARVQRVSVDEPTPDWGRLH
jgi:hypothetical protein